MNPVVHFELPYDDPARISAFYKGAFGWKTKALGEKMGNYILATTTQEGPNGFPRDPGRIYGGFYQSKPDWPEQHPSVVIAVDDIRRAMAKVAAAGGRVLGDPMDIPGVGAYVSFVDTEGNRVSMLQPLPMPGKAARPKAGAKTKKAGRGKKR